MKLIILSSAVFACISSAFVIDTTSTTHMRPISVSNDQDHDEVATLYIPMGGDIIADSYIVILKNTANATQHREWLKVQSATAAVSSSDIYLNNAGEADATNGIQYTYDSQTWKGYSGRFRTDLLEKIRRSPDVDYVEKDSVVYTSELQRDAPWGLARISHRRMLNLETFNRYPYQKQAGKGVKVYVIDTGINIHHVDFEGRASWGITTPEGDEDIDGHGHGSHCAGTVAGKQFGVAKKSLPVAVKVLRSDGSGSMSGVVAGVSWSTEKHQQDLATDEKYKGSVANMSLGGAKSIALNLAVNEAVNTGMVFVVAAGNGNRNACQHSPASAELAITVGASNIRDKRASFSNHGTCVNVFAPGVNILSIGKGANDTINTMSGTSMAAPHVSGLAAYFISLEDQDGPVSPGKIQAKILELATPDKLAGLPEDTPNRLVYNGGMSD